MTLKEQMISFLQSEVPLWQVITYTAGTGLIIYMLSHYSKRPEVKEKQDITSEINSTSEVETEEELFGGDIYKIKNNYNMLNGPFKLVLCVNMQLKMGSGKIAAQCGHATLGQAKIAIKIDKEEMMYEIYEKAKAAGLVTYLVEDAGRTQIAAGSRTVLAIGPAPTQAFDGITSSFKLL